MRTVNIFSKETADKLSALGFNYNIQKTDKGNIYSFIASKELMELLNSEYEKSSFFMSKYYNFSEQEVKQCR